MVPLEPHIGATTEPTRQRFLPAVNQGAARKRWPWSQPGAAHERCPWSPIERRPALSGCDAPTPAVAKGRPRAGALESPACERERRADAGRREGPPASGGPGVARL